MSEQNSSNYYANVNPTLLEVVEGSAINVCEFGCGAGAFARAVKARNPKVKYIGVELEASQLEKAKDILDGALACNLDHPDWHLDSEFLSLCPQEGFDHVIFGDVLEHLYNPQKVLGQAVQKLKPGGSALVCIPNVQHWSVIAQLIVGRWPQLDSGLFDRTHIRWFTLSDMITLLTNAGLVVEKVIPRIFSPEKGAAFLEALMPAAQSVGVDHSQFKQRSYPLQYVLVGRKSE